MSIGSKIKALRRAKDLTQDELAEILGVSSKAVSQWECDRTSPDISLLPVLCNYFEVTSDELLEIDIFHKTIERDKIVNESNDLTRNGKIAESIAKLKEGLKRFPTDAFLMCLLINEYQVYIYTFECTQEEKERMQEECRNYSEYILAHSIDDNSRYTAIDFLSKYYNRKGDEDKAWEYAIKLPVLCNSQEFLFTELNTGTAKAQSDQNLKLTLFNFFVIRMLANYQLDSGEWLYSEDERLELRDKKFAIFSLLFEKGDFGFFGHHLAESHEAQAREYAKRGNREKCLYYLTQATNCAIGFIQYMQSKRFVHSSLLWKGFDYPSSGVSLSEQENIATIILSRTEYSEYDSLRNDAEFTAIIEHLAEYAGQNDY